MYLLVNEDGSAKVVEPENIFSEPVSSSNKWPVTFEVQADPDGYGGIDSYEVTSRDHASGEWSLVEIIKECE